MRKLTLVCLSLALVMAAGAALAAGNSQLLNYHRADANVINGYSSTSHMGAAKADTVFLLGGPDLDSGKFQDPVSGAIPVLEPEWYGVDLTVSLVTIWHVDTVNAANLDESVNPNHAMWCGEYIDGCPPVDPDETPNPGYRNGYEEYLDFYGTAPDAGQPTTVQVLAVANVDTEPDYDFLYLRYEDESGSMIDVSNFGVGGGWTGSNQDTATGEWVEHLIDVTFTVDDADYVGPGNNQIHLRWHGFADDYWSDSDCYWPTVAGMAQLDNIEVIFNSVSYDLEDFESAPYSWVPVLPPFVGDFSKAWDRLDEIDPCAFNDTPMVAFIDDGEVVPGTGGYLGTTWDYGPDSYIKNMEGGLAGPDYQLFNEVWSEPITWPGPAYAGAGFDFDVFAHSDDAGGMYYVWHVRSSTDGMLTWDLWQDDGWVYYGSGQFGRGGNPDISTRLLLGLTHAQLAMGVWEYGIYWDEVGTDGTPAPYFDNVAFYAYTVTGPAIFTQGIRLAQDNFPTIQDIDLTPGNWGTNDVRFDMARTIANDLHEHNDPGDSLTADITLIRVGGVMVNMPRLYYYVKTNPMFDPYRDPSYSFDTLDYVEGAQVYIGGTTPIPDRYEWDLPDEDFLYPGDVVHYYFWAEDQIGGVPGVTTLPADLSGFAVFPGDAGYQPLDWNSAFIMRALPTLFDGSGAHPEILFWNDLGNRGGENEWYGALTALGYQERVDYDVYYTHGPTSGVGNGLGGRASLACVVGYNTMLYSSGNLTRYTISPQVWTQDHGDDLGLVDLWLQEGGKNMLLCGDNLFSVLNADVDAGGGGAEGQNFLATWMPINFITNDIIDDIGGQSAPLIKPVPGNNVALAEEFIGYGGCPAINDFDGVEVAGTTEKIAFFADLDGNDTYAYAAGLNNEAGGNKIVAFPVGFLYWYTPAKAAAPTAARTNALEDIMIYFGESATPPTTGVTPSLAFGARNFPNPFNPSTKIRYSTPRAGLLTIKIYNVRGELVKSLEERYVQANTTGDVVWNGDDNDGNSVASGVYFAQTKIGNYETMNKLALVK